MRKNKSLLVILAGVALTLTSCGTSDTSHYPSNKDDEIVNGIVGGDDIAYNDFETFYDSIASGTTIQAKALNDILYRIAQKQLTIDEADLTKKAQQVLIDEVSGGNYDTDYKFDELRYAMSLRKNMYNVVCDSSHPAKKDLLITPDLTFDQIFGCDYSNYLDKKVKPDIIRRELVGKYIYDNSYSSIGNTNARDVKIVKIADRSDKPGAAYNTIKAFIDTYILSESATDEQRDLSNLARIWLGTDLTDDDRSFISTNGLVTLEGQINDEVAKIKDDRNLTDKTLESKYTNSYTYSVEKGKRLAIDSLSKTDLITDGYYLKSTGIDGIPTDLKNRIFSTNYNIDPTATKRDVTYTIGGHRYLTPKIVENEDDMMDKIVHYDSSGSSYYIVEIRDVITTGALEKKDSDSDEVKKSKEERAIKVAYELATNATYVKDSTVYWLKNSNISYSDSDFYNYIKDNYPEVFEKDDD